MSAVDERARAVSMFDVRRIEIVVLAVLAASCASSHAGWGKGPQRELFESPDLQLRRAVVRADPATGELVLPWIGARVPAGADGVVESCRLLVFRDADGDGQADENEILLERHSVQPAVKVLFADVRVRTAPLGHAGEKILARLEARTDRSTKTAQVELVPGE